MALQRCNLSAVPGAKAEGGRFLTAHLPCNSIKQPSDLARCEKTFVAGCHDCDLTGCPRAQHIRGRRAAKPRQLAAGVRAKPALGTSWFSFRGGMQLNDRRARTRRIRTLRSSLTTVPVQAVEASEVTTSHGKSAPLGHIIPRANTVCAMVPTVNSFMGGHERESI